MLWNRLFLLIGAVSTALASALPSTDILTQHTLGKDGSKFDVPKNQAISQELFDELEELSRIVDIAYCVGTLNSGIESPFQCLSFCKDFPKFELVRTWNTGITLSDSCGYLALDHNSSKPRIIVAFRGTYSLTNALIDLAAAQQAYLPYPSDGHTPPSETVDKCESCTVHAGFLASWSQTEKIIAPVIKTLLKMHPTYRLTLIGHSLGGAVAALAGLDFNGRGWKPYITTFGEPRVGNENLAEYFNAHFGEERYQRVTHYEDPVPQLPPLGMGYRHHAHEVFIEKGSLPFRREDVRKCDGNEDPECVAGCGFVAWRSLYAHRDYFHRMGLCLPEGSWLGKLAGGGGMEL